MTDDEKAIRQVVDTWMQASLKGDLDTILGLMTNDAIFMVPGQEPFGKEAFAAASRGMAGLKLTGATKIVELKVLGDWAFIRNHIDLTMTTSDDKATHRSGYTLTLLRKETGRWRLTRDANLLTVRS